MPKKYMERPFPDTDTAEALKAIVVRGEWHPELEAMSSGQRAILAVMMDPEAIWQPNQLNLSKRLRIAKNSVLTIRRIKAQCTPAEWDELLGNKRSMYSLTSKYCPTTKQKAVAESDVATRRQVDSLVWEQLRVALDNLVELPAPASVILIIKNNNARVTGINNRFAKAAAWFKEFEKEWNATDGSKGESNSDGQVDANGRQHPTDHDDNAGDGHQDVGSQPTEPPVEPPAREADNGTDSGR